MTVLTGCWVRTALLFRQSPFRPIDRFVIAGVPALCVAAKVMNVRCGSTRNGCAAIVRAVAPKKLVLHATGHKEIS